MSGKDWADIVKPEAHKLRHQANGADEIDLTGLMAGTAAVATTSDITTHANLTATHGAGTIASVAAATALITTHASSTDAHIGGAGTVLSVAAGTLLIASHAALTTGVHGLGNLTGVVKNIITEDSIIPSGYAYYVPESLEIPAAYSLEIAASAVLEIG